MLRVIQLFKPRWVIAENVRGILSIQDGLVFEQVCVDLEDAGYEVQPFVIPAVATDAHHRRDRVWFCARYVPDTGCEGVHERRKPTDAGEILRGSGGVEPDGLPCGEQAKRETMADCSGQGSQGGEDARGITGSGEERKEQFAGCSESRKRRNWLPEPSVGRVANGIPRRVDRLRGLGNAIVPQVALRIMEAIRETDETRH